MPFQPNGAGAAFASLFDVHDILCQTSIRERDELLLEMLKRLAFNYGIGNVPNVLNAVLAREQANTTVLATGIAVPHARIVDLQRPFVSIATSAAGITFSDGYAPVQLVVMVLVPRDNPASYLQILSSIAGLCQNEQTAANVARLTRAEDVHSFFEGNGIVLPEFVCAEDIMTPDPPSLLDTESLKQAIDLLTDRNQSTLAVVDKSKELVGVVTAEALLRICLPEYLLWIDDLSPMLHFEPFVQVLRNEAQSSLADLMTQDYAVVDAQEPAVAVAEALIRHNADQCYVVRAKKLVGAISLSQFFRKVFRE